MTTTTLMSETRFASRAVRGAATQSARNNRPQETTARRAGTVKRFLAALMNSLAASHA